MDARECESRLKQMTAGVFVCVRACVGARRESFERERIFCVCGFSLLVFCVLLLSLLHKQGGWGGGERARARVRAQATHSTRNEGREERERERAWGAARMRRPPPPTPWLLSSLPWKKEGTQATPPPPVKPDRQFPPSRLLAPVRDGRPVRRPIARRHGHRPGEQAHRLARHARPADHVQDVLVARAPRRNEGADLGAAVGGGLGGEGQVALDLVVCGVVPDLVFLREEWERGGENVFFFFLGVGGRG
jgi:hypothetical protein